MSNTREPMGGSDLGPNRGTGTPFTNTKRVCWAIQTLVSEVQALFPETPVEYANYDGRNTALSVTFDLTALPGGDSVIFNDLMGILEADERVFEVITADYDQAFVEMRSNPRTQDSREPFGLADALHVLSGEDNGDDDEGWVEAQFLTVAEGYGQWGSL